VKRLLAAVGLLTFLGAGAGLGYYLYLKHVSRDIRGSSTQEFTPSEPPVPPQPKPKPVKPPKPGKKPVRVVEGAVWPTWGYDDERTRFVPGSAIRPPFSRRWVFRGRTLIEYPPAIAYGRLYVATNEGLFYSLDAATGKPVWRYRSGRCVAASPAVDAGVVFLSFLNKPPCNSSRSDIDGRVIAFDAKTGKVRWRRAIGPSESSPLVAFGLVFVGDWRGDVYGLDEKTGRIRWTFKTGDKVKAGVALTGRRLYVGSYDGHLYALYARTGNLIWKAASQDRFGGLGQFYSTPAVAYGRVYVGSTDGKVYSYGATTGDLRWSHSTGGYVYASPAVWKERILVGSYSGWFYAFDAATGDVLWKFKANGPISGSATVLHGIVYFSTFARKTYALDAKTGRVLWTYLDGKYSPVVADTQRLYLVGYTRVYGMVPR
jgi:outer membrane protein assembly factor BamB